MNPLILGEVFKIGAGLIERFFPDPALAANAKLELLRMQQTGELAQLASTTELAKAQIGVNAVEAASSSLFIAGWRPAVGWTCAGGLFYQVIAAPVLGWVAGNLLQWSAPPALEMDTLMTLLFGLLGLGGYRTIEKARGVEGNR